MRSPSSFALAFLPERKLAERLQQLAGRRLYQEICRPKKWLFDDRVKEEESALAKLQLGPVRSLGEMQDMYAATVVVPTKAEVDDAIAAIESDMPGAEVVERRRPRPETFLYDDVHMVAQLGDRAAGLARGVQVRRFEIQIRTGLQYAWWRATHDVLYKGNAPNWQLQRVAGQVRAALELLDAHLADLRGAARLQGEPDPEDPEFAVVAGWLDRWPEARRPDDVRRFYLAVRDLSKAADVSVTDVGGLLESDMARSLVATEDVTPFQAVLGTVVDGYGANIVDRLRSNRYVLVTPELELACAATASITAARRVEL
jgi:ppGpp synthetase/RelA/SpoT-type nucleotidyltranferase